MASTPWCAANGCNDRATHVIHSRSGKYRRLEDDEIALPPEFTSVCRYHLALFIRWQRQAPVRLPDE